MSTVKDVHEEMKAIDREIETQPVIHDDNRSLGDVFAYLGELIGRLGQDTGNLLTLRIDLLKAELREGAKGLAIDSTLAVVGAVIGLFAVITATFAIVGFIAAALPMQGYLAFAVSCTIVTAVYGLIAAGLIIAGIKHLKERGFIPERSINEVQKDKDLLSELKN